MEPTGSAVPIVLRSSVHHATFFSLPLVEELLRHARGVLNGVDTTGVRSRLQHETRCEACWPVAAAAASAPSSSSSFASSPAFLLRLGVLRALGIPAPGAGDNTSDASMALGREIVELPAASGKDAADAPLWYLEAEQDELQHLALGEWCEDLIFFALHHGFSAVQLRCVLLTAMRLINLVAEFSAHTTDMEAETRCSQILEGLLIEQACGLPNKVVEIHHVTKEITEEVPDPECVSDLEAKLAKEKNKKQQQVLREQLLKVPLISQTRTVVHEEKVFKEVVIGPYFTLHEVARILEYLSSTVVQHWRLFRNVFSESQPKKVYNELQVQWDVWPFCVPPLSEFLDEDAYAMELERKNMMNECEKAINNSFNEEFVQPLSELARERDAILEHWELQQLQDEEDNKRNALNGSGYLKVVRAFSLRLGKRIERSDLVCQTETSTVPLLLQEPTLTSTSLSPHARQSKSTHPAPSTSGSRRSFMSKGRVTSASATSTAAVVTGTVASASSQTVPLPADTVFSLEAVEARLSKLEAATQATIDSLKEKPKKRG